MAHKPKKPARKPVRILVRRGGAVRKPSSKSKAAAGSRWALVRYSLITAAVWTVLAGAVLFSHWISQLPDTENLLAYAPSHDITLIDSHGRTIARRGLVQGEYVQVGELPNYVTNAFIAIEDRRFRTHFGIDPWGIARALFADIREGAFVQGGSTITQQLAKNLFLKPDRTFERKIEEAILALYLETRYSKDEILTLYLNRVYFGAGVYGIEAAAEKFFNKRAADLSLTEAAILAGVVKAPSRYNPATTRTPRLTAPAWCWPRCKMRASSTARRKGKRRRRGPGSCTPRRRRARAISSTTCWRRSRNPLVRPMSG